MIQMNSFTKQIWTYRLREGIYSYQEGRVEKRGKLGIWD